jgi:hypothetical protein
VTSSATGRGYGHELHDLIGATARSLEKGPRAGQRAVSAPPRRRRVARKLEMETLLVEEARNSGLQDSAAGRAVASLWQHRDEGAESFNRLAEGDVVTTPQCRPAGVSVTMKGGLLATRPEDNGPTTRNGVSDTGRKQLQMLNVDEDLSFK